MPSRRGVGFVRRDSSIDLGFVRRDSSIEFGFVRRDSLVEFGFVRCDSSIEFGFVRRDSAVDFDFARRDSSVARALQDISRALPRNVTLSNRAAREADVSLWPDSGRNIFSKIPLGDELRAWSFPFMTGFTY
jgi:hypothetical protein